MFDEFDTTLDTGLGDDTSGASFDFGGISSDMGMMGGAMQALPVALPMIRGGLRGNPGGLVAGAAGAGGILYGGGRIAGRAVGQLWDMAKRFGPDLVAGAAGMTGEQLLAVFLDRKPWRRHRRRRGISSRDVRTTRRVVRFVNRISHDIGCVRHSPRHARHHRR